MSTPSYERDYSPETSPFRLENTLNDGYWPD